MTTKIILIWLLHSFLNGDPGTSIYDVTIQSIDGKTIPLSNFKGKKILIAEFDPANFKDPELLLLDSLQSNNKNLQVVLVPAQDFSGNIETSGVTEIQTKLKLSFLITQPSSVKKSSGRNQQQLLKWLTAVDENGHFDYDADQPGNIYLTTEKGTLYAVIQKGTPNSLIRELVAQETDF